jgi:prevent-host-death family protein
MGIHVNIGEAKNRLSELIAASLRGEEVILSKAGKPVARILALDTAINDAKVQRKAQWKAWIGSFADKFPPDAEDALLAPNYSNEELDSFSKGL